MYVCALLGVVTSARKLLMKNCELKLSSSEHMH